MRLLIDSLILLMLMAIVIGVVTYRHTNDRQARDRQTVRDSLDRIREQITFHGAIDQDAQAQAVYPWVYPRQVHLGWFPDGQPKNPLIPEDQPWIDIAPPDDYTDQPPDPLVTGPGQAAFWYNPNLGLIRARVPWQVSERLTLKLYNLTNNTSLQELPYDRNPDRSPVAYNPNPVKAGQYASPIQETAGQIYTQEPETAPPRAEPSVPWWVSSDGPAPQAGAEQPAPGTTPKRPSLRSR